MKRYAKASDYTEQIKIERIQSVRRTNYYGKEIIVLHLLDSELMLPLSTDNKLRDVINLLGTDTQSWLNRSIAVKRKSFLDKEKGVINYLSIELPQQSLFGE